MMIPFRTVVTYLNYKDVSLESLNEAAALALPAGIPLRKRASAERHRAYLAGRASVAAAFQILGLKAFVIPEPKFGYLQVVDEVRSVKKGAYANISHTSQLAVAVVSDHPVGIDVESSLRDATRVMKRVASREEWDWLQKKGDDAVIKGMAASIVLWSAKEAFSKAVGLGIKFGLRDFIIRLNGESPFEAEMKYVGEIPHRLINPRVEIMRLGDFVLAVCGELESLKGLKSHQVLL